MAQRYDIFISYRRKGGVQDARLVDEKLRNSGYYVSFDIDTLGRGKFTDTLKTRLKNCNDFIVIFEPTYYERFYDENGKVKPEEELNEDWCYLELKNALLMEKNIIPLIPKDFVFPNNLPKAVKEVAEMNAIQLTEKEFKEIFEYKVKSYLISKPKFTYRHKKPIIITLSIVILGVIAFLVNFGLESRKQREEAEKQRMETERRAEEQRIETEKRAAEREAFVADSMAKAKELQFQSFTDSIKAKQAEDAARRAATAVPASTKRDIVWVHNGDETGRILRQKLSRAGLKDGSCSGNGIKVSVSKPSCKTTHVGVRCSYTPVLTATTCGGASVDKFTFGQTFNGPSTKEESVSKQKMLEDLENANFSSWVSALQAMR
jgi:hypothetical protein